MLEELTNAIDELSAVDPAELADGETIVALHRQLERLTATVTKAVAAFDASRNWEADAARSAAAWITTRCRVAQSTARRRLRLGRALRQMPATEEAWLAGDIGGAQVEVLASVRQRVGEAMFGPDEGNLVAHATELSHRDFGRLVSYYVQAADPDGAEAEAEDQREDRRLHLSQSFEGMWFLDGALDPISGEVVSRALRTIEDELFKSDWADAKSEPGDDVSVGALARTPAQRRADALVEMARRAMAVPAGAGIPQPLFTVLVGYETFVGRVCELASGTVVTPRSLLPWLTAAYVERVVFDAPDRVRNVGVRRRLFTGATRRAVQVRDRACFSEFCDVPADECEIDHVEPYAAGGLTVDTNGRPACAYHHRLLRAPPPRPAA